MIKNLVKDRQYYLRIKNQYVIGVFIRKVKFLFFWEKYEFLVIVHVTDYDHNKEYDQKTIFQVSFNDIIKPYEK